ncbi:hypothetical protein SAMN04488063_0796 [Halopelagius inordinatus]|uniref:Uncharacterized protein n=1 Tax=Halopelagius inordinatus TaxID=553467 RepID=A0A1I2MKG3_9EURY|nr:hypothetical protein SAMN04488063_0796 [Halopelagius inordinatus]
MRMGNYFCVKPVVETEMSVDSAFPGIDHVTVVPTNYRPDDSEGDGERETDSGETPATDRR